MGVNFFSWSPNRTMGAEGESLFGVINKPLLFSLYHISMEAYSLELFFSRRKKA